MLVSHIIIIRVFPRDVQQKVVFAVMFGIVLSQHLYSTVFYYAEYRFDSTTFTMMLLSRLISLSSNYRDGDPRFAKELSKYQERFKVEKMPSIIETTAFAYHGSGAISGSWFEFRDCMDHFHKRGVYSEIPIGKCVRLSIQRAITGLLCVYIHLLISPYFHVDYCATSLFATYTMPYKMVFMYVTLEGVLFFYFTAFCFLDSTNHACGISFNGYAEITSPEGNKTSPSSKEKGEPLFNRVINIKLWKFLTGTDIREIINSWNVSIHNWLKYYVYVRQLVPGQKPGWR